MPENEWTLYVRNQTLSRVAQIDDYQSFEGTARFNEIGTWTLNVDRRSPVATYLNTPSYGVELTQNGRTVLSGPVVKRRHVRSTSGTHLEVSGYDDLVYLFVRVVSPSPTEGLPPYTITAYDVRTGQASTVLRAYVNVNVGPGALSERRIPGVTLGVDPLIGSTITGRGRWQNLLGLLQELAIAGGNVGFRVRQSGSNLEFQTYQPVDRSASIRFSEDLGNLAEFEYEASAPKVTYTYVAGGGEGTARTIYEASNNVTAATWGRIETFVDRRDTTDAAELAQAATEALQEGDETAELSMTPVDLPGMTYGTHYDLGDKVTVLPEGPDVEIKEIIREVKIALTPNGPQKINPVVGTPGKSEILGLFRAFQQFDTRLTNLERR